MRTPFGLAPFALLPLAALAFFPGVWLYGAYAYQLSHPYHFHNSTSNQNDTLNITCLCQQYSVCGCEDNKEPTFFDSLFNQTDSDGLPKNTSDVVVATVNGTQGIYINGTLPNGTTAPDPSISENDAIVGKFAKLSGYWVMAAVTVAAVTML